MVALLKCKVLIIFASGRAAPDREARAKILPKRSLAGGVVITAMVSKVGRVIANLKSRRKLVRKIKVLQGHCETVRDCNVRNKFINVVAQYPADAATHALPVRCCPAPVIFTKTKFFVLHSEVAMFYARYCACLRSVPAASADPHGVFRLAILKRPPRKHTQRCVPVAIIQVVPNGLVVVFVFDPKFSYRFVVLYSFHVYFKHGAVALLAFDHGLRTFQCQRIRLLVDIHDGNVHLDSL